MLLLTAAEQALAGTDPARGNYGPQTCDAPMHTLKMNISRRLEQLTLRFWSGGRVDKRTKLHRKFYALSQRGLSKNTAKGMCSVRRFWRLIINSFKCILSTREERWRQVSMESTTICAQCPKPVKLVSNNDAYCTCPMFTAQWRHITCMSCRLTELQTIISCLA